MNKTFLADLPPRILPQALSSIPESEKPEIKRHGIRWAMVLSSGFVIRIGDTALNINGLAS